MLAEALAALAAAAGTAVVQAAGTDAWSGFREGAARWFGRGDAERERAELERLEQAAVALGAAGDSGAEVRIRQETAWQTRFETVLEAVDEAGREAAAAELRALLAQYAAPAAGVSAGPGGVAAGRDVNISAEQGSIAATVIHGGASIHPPTPDPRQG
ncbi:hypothetical protein ABT147_46695 [Streptomyces sp. NPDC001868]|uniref:hypothetical protein n=1 Tax=Streptomyces sp. NPDC001868 TaxID=3154401 RepID=UPI00332B0D77